MVIFERRMYDIEQCNPFRIDSKKPGFAGF